MSSLLEVVFYQHIVNLPFEGPPLPNPWYIPSLLYPLCLGSCSIHCRYCPHNFLSRWVLSFWRTAYWKILRSVSPYTHLLPIHYTGTFTSVPVGLLFSSAFGSPCVELEFEGFPSFSTNVIYGVFQCCYCFIDFQDEMREIHSSAAAAYLTKTVSHISFQFILLFFLIFLRWILCVLIVRLSSFLMQAFVAINLLQSTVLAPYCKFCFNTSFIEI